VAEFNGQMISLFGDDARQQMASDQFDGYVFDHNGKAISQDPESLRGVSNTVFYGYEVHDRDNDNPGIFRHYFIVSDNDADNVRLWNSIAGQLRQNAEDFHDMTFPRFAYDGMMAQMRQSAAEHGVDISNLAWLANAIEQEEQSNGKV
jgi:hypothetical protein